MYIDRKNDYFNIAQLRLKTITLGLSVEVEAVELNSNIRAMTSFSSYLVLESLTLLEFLTKKHAAVHSFKQKYKIINMQLKTNLQDDKLFYFFSILKIFYLPAYRRQNFYFLLSQIYPSKFIFNLAHPTLIPFLPNTYFRWKCLINVVFFFNKRRFGEIFLFLTYLGFYFSDEEEFYYGNLDTDKYMNSEEYLW